MKAQLAGFSKQRKQTISISFPDRRVADRRQETDINFFPDRRRMNGQDSTLISIGHKVRSMGDCRTKRNRPQLTPHPPWIIKLEEHIAPYWQAVLDCPILDEAATGTLSVRQMQGWMVQLYPFIESFPKWLALNLTKADDSASRSFFIDNIRTEKRHGEQWVSMARGFGVESKELSQACPLPEVEAMTHWLWSINTRGSLAEGVAATSYAIEGVTQGISKRTIQGFPFYDGREGVSLDGKAYSWMKSHVSYDDLHPLEALEIIKRTALTEDVRDKVRIAAQRSLEYMRLALQTCYTAYKN